MLEYENQMFLEILEEDGLVITAKGLGLETVFTNLLKVYCDPGNLIIVLGTTDHDENYFIDQLKKQDVKHLPRVITAQHVADERNSTYLEGGVLFISGRILVVDLLKNRVPLNLVTGIFVYRAHNILNSYQEAFALRLYRQNNKTGFIKAFTESALAFTVGFSQVERVMKTLFVSKLYLWPRFHSVVNSSLSKNKPEVIELHVKLTPQMVNIQTALLDVMNFLIKELKKINKYLDLDELTVENAIAKKFHKQLQLQLDPIWNQLSFKSKQLIADLKTLRYLLMSLTYEESVSFYAKLNDLRTMDYAMKSSGWMLLDVVEDMFKYAKSRVYNEKNELKPEPNPKWTALSEVLAEIHRNYSKEHTEEKEPKVLILTQDKTTCNQLKNFLTLGADTYLKREAARKLKNKNQNTHKKLPTTSELKNTKDIETSEIETASSTEETEDQQESYILTLSQHPRNDSFHNSEEQPLFQNYFEDCSQMAELDLTTISTTAPVLVIQSLRKDGDSMSLPRILTELMPQYIIMYVADISAIRRLEVYQNNYPSIPVTIYFLIYGGSVEEQGYLTSLRREKEAFDMLINTKTTMVVPVEQDGKCEDIIADDLNMSKNTRKGGMEETVKKPKVIVDMREFRSELPALLHKRGIEIEPVTLIIGDYILSPEICVERKSISDLIGSLNSGRLYNQVVAMTRYYTKSILLIEFDQNKPFCLQGNYYISKDMKSIDITSKLQLLTMHFPRLKLVWSPSPNATAQLFEELKHGRDEPDGTRAAQIGIDEDADDKKAMTEKYNCNIQDFIIKLPGVHSKNIRVILNKGKSLDHLINMSQEEITELLGNKNDAQFLYDALHKKCCDTNEQSGSSTVGRSISKVKSRGLFFKKSK